MVLDQLTLTNPLTQVGNQALPINKVVDQDLKVLVLEAAEAAAESDKAAVALGLAVTAAKTAAVLVQRLEFHTLMVAKAALVEDPMVKAALAAAAAIQIVGAQGAVDILAEAAADKLRGKAAAAAQLITVVVNLTVTTPITVMDL